MNNSVYKKDFDEITDKIKLVMGNSIEINFILDDYILAIKSGKYKWFIAKTESIKYESGAQIHKTIGPIVTSSMSPGTYYDCILL